jgi:FlaA1/EpsC-like NDP-sugar epimerase
VRKILVVGELGPGAQLYRSGMLINNLRYTIVGFVGDSAQSVLGVNRLGGLSDLNQIFEGNSVDEVFLMLPHTQSAEIAFVIDQCERAQVQVNVVNDFNRLGAAPYRLSSYAGFPVVGLRYFPLDDPENRFFKRSFDILFSLFFLVLVG